MTIRGICHLKKVLGFTGIEIVSFIYGGFEKGM
jgi:hypothetical protein